MSQFLAEFLQICFKHAFLQYVLANDGQKNAIVFTPIGGRGRGPQMLVFGALRLIFEKILPIFP